MKIRLRFNDRARFEEFRASAGSMAVDAVLEERVAFSDASQVDAEYLSTGMAERLVSVPKTAPNSACVIRTNPWLAPFPAKFIITGLWMPKRPSVFDEVNITFRAIQKAVAAHNKESTDSIRTVGISEDYLMIVDLGIDKLQQILIDIMKI